MFGLILVVKHVLKSAWVILRMVFEARFWIGKLLVWSWPNDCDAQLKTALKLLLHLLLHVNQLVVHSH